VTQYDASLAYCGNMPGHCKEIPDADRASAAHRPLVPSHGLPPTSLFRTTHRSQFLTVDARRAGVKPDRSLNASMA
jgi:hypothetical protein